ncbi:MAG: membrane protein insertase YidC [Gammaproteobacteria bacterium]|nr:membrane protein insertase YidC [Gammaproteobacteria bacterium]
MDWQRISILGAIGLVSILLINQWGEFQERNRPVISQETTITTTPGQAVADTALDTVLEADAAADSSMASDIPTATASSENPASLPSPGLPAKNRLVSVETDTLSVLIDTLGGDLVKVALLQHKESLEDKNKPLILLNRTESTIYIAQSGLIGQNATDTAAGRPLFRSGQPQYSLAQGQDSLSVDLYYQQGDVKITKRFTFQRNSNLVNVEYLIDNQSPETWQAAMYGQIKRDSHNPVSADGLGMQPYLGAALTTTETNYKKLDFDDLADPDLVRAGGFKTSIQGGWVAMVQHYFLSAWIPDSEQTNNYSLRKGRGDIYLLGFTSPQTAVPAGGQGVIKASFYAGPKDIDLLESISPYLDLTVDYGWLWWIAKPLFHVLDFIHGILGSWGWSIIALTVLIKLAFFHLSATSYKSMAKMRKFGPEMQRMKELYGDDRQKMSQEMMKLYKKEKINPLSGCLPILVQMPVFISLYWVLMESVQLRHTPFLGWIADLSVKDPYFILPVVMGVTMWIQQKLNPTPPDPTQAKVMQLLPLVFTFMFMWFPAGLVLYWVVNNTLSIAQQYVITRQIEAGDKT